MISPFKFGLPLLFAFDPETAHGLSIAALRSGVPLACPAKPDPRLVVEVAGLRFPNPLGMAAGYDKNGEIPDALLRLGFGFAEVGTVTPLPQSGNPKPRIFRLMSDRGVINRLGFNNQGHEALAQRLAKRQGGGIVGVNIGANKDSTDRIADYEAGVRAFARRASYLTVNISSPNTPGLRALQSREALAELLGRVIAARAETEAATPIFLKIAPDLIDADLDNIAGELLAQKLDGLIVSNTTLSRSGLEDTETARQAGGLSGRPLFLRSTAMLARMRRRLGPDFPVVGVGGIESTETAIEKIRAGADLVQLYTGMIYAGPGLPGDIVSGMSRFAAREGLASIRDIRDSATERWAEARLD
ncbi:quinone-dependent dihydroorotate dehydrogenase [Mesorhizobium sp. J428]|uniref:quinone-dependent dihydroorotate dehydrogenase n=1 Tax=Mesorhizobium sp. J428 TaxID=2898440 RepID=UPI0021514877|nr:quinone-dependent dihydroorotate dehydrogenase [Mesorhizobium sp. J428]MCR5858356.1 quinone-dependent dihydroorotate dehydrogenase [Mesorhizobium sp. J428]